jgi:hypothetical protein
MHVLVWGRGKTRRLACDRGHCRSCNCHRGTGSTATRQYSAQSKVAFGLTRVSRAGPAGWVLPGSLSFAWNRGCFCRRVLLDRPHPHHARRQAHAPTRSVRFQFSRTRKRTGSGFSNPSHRQWWRLHNCFSEIQGTSKRKGTEVLVLHRSARGKRELFFYFA